MLKQNLELKSLATNIGGSEEKLQTTDGNPLSLPLINQSISNRNSNDSQDSFLRINSKKKHRTLHSEEDILLKKSKESPKFRKGSLYRLFQYTKKEMKLFLLGNFFLLINAGSQISIPYLSGQFMDIVGQNKDASELNLKGILFLLASLSLAISNFAKSFCFSLMSEKITIKMKKDLFSALINHDVTFFDGKKTGELLSRIGSDIATVKWAASGNFSMFIRNTVVCIGSFFLLFAISWKLTLYMVLVIPFFAAFSVFYGRYVKKFSKLYQEIIADGSIIAEEVFGNIRVVKSFSTEEQETAHFNSTMENAYSVGYKKALLESIFFSIILMLLNVAILVTLWYGGSLVLNSELSSGQLASFIFYAIFMASSSTAIAAALTQLVSASGVCERIFELMDYKSLINNRGGTILSGVKDLDGSIEFKDVTFSYPSKTQVNVLKNLSLKVESGEVVALVGTSGGGKSTIVSLIERFYDPTQGQILIDGTDLRNYDLASLHQKIGLVSQEPTLFSGTIEENIVYGVEKYTRESLDKAAKLANCYDLIHDKSLFPKGYETLVGERGVKLSGGQKQRVAIARALIKEPKILILDEATSALDAENEFQVQKAIETLMHQDGLTMVVIAHRLSTIINCKRIIVISEGRIVEEGKHEELLELNGVYKNLIEKQMHGVIA